MQKVVQNGTMFQKLIQYMQIALELAKTAAPQMVEKLSQDVVQTMGAAGGTPGAGASTKMFQSDNIAGIGKQETAQVRNARERSGEASQPSGNGAVRSKEDKK